MPPVAKFNNEDQEKMTRKEDYEKKLWALVKRIIRHVCQDHIYLWLSLNLNMKFDS